MPFPYDKYPWINYQELNLAYFIEHFQEIFQQWDQLYHYLLSWQASTEEDLEAWMTAVEGGLESWKTGVEAGLEAWKTEAQTDITGWETATIAALDAWKIATTAVFEEIRTAAAASATAAAGSATDAAAEKTAAETAQAAAEAAAASIASELTQIQTNTTDIYGLKSTVSAITGTGKNIFDKQHYNTYTGYFSSSTPTLTFSSTSVTIYVKCKPNTAYTVSKIATSRFSIGFTSTVPAYNVAVYGAVSGNSRTYLTSTSSNDSLYIVVFAYITGSETATFENLLNSIQIEEGSLPTSYSAFAETAIDTLARNNADEQRFEITSISFTTGGFYHKDTGNIANSDSYSYSEKIEIPYPISKIAVYTACSNDNSGIVFWDEENNYITGSNLYSGLKITRFDISVPENAVYVGISCRQQLTDGVKIVLIDTAKSTLNIAKILERINPENTDKSDSSLLLGRWYDNGYYTDYTFNDVLHNTVFSLYNSDARTAFSDNVFYKGKSAVICEIPSDSLVQRIQLRYQSANRIALIGTQEFDLAVYLKNANAISSITVTVYTENSDGTSQLSYELVIDNTCVLKNGWNFIRYTVPHTVGNSLWDYGYNISVYITATSAATVYIGEIVQVKPDKAKIVFVDDHAYQEFRDNAYTPYFKPAQIPVTWAIQPGRLGAVLGDTGTLLTQNDVLSLADDPYSEISWHSWDATSTSSMTDKELKTENRKCLSAIRKMGVLPDHFWRAAWKQNDAPEAMSCADDLPAFASWGSGHTPKTVFPFLNRYDIYRQPLHGLFDTLTDGHYVNLDKQFDQLRKTHRLIIYYTHSCIADPSLASAGSISPSQAEYFADLCADAMNNGWLECLTFNQLCTRYHY